MEFKYAKLRGRIKEKFGTEREFSEALGINQVTLSRKFSGKTQFSSNDIKQMSKLLEIPLEEAGQYFFA
jgi:transcriptional regulator with XRE-family HTH domain